ncbi:hypothetical protein B0T18DRAFT_397982 [Schizothecium vesticola]|uniref:Secreted protein n=1 Tax=Schizothecium vesticola TaxID=314040 RepID=A0AA40F9S8_9PEZI|nr:hypothetical protein B0T18DRAFT_397982 [Schizothecium vesticola]
MKVLPPLVCCCPQLAMAMVVNSHACVSCTSHAMPLSGDLRDKSQRMGHTEEERVTSIVVSTLRCGARCRKYACREE